jgi:hypothetical protein
MPFLEFHFSDISTWFGPSLALNLYILSIMILLNVVYITGSTFMIFYLRRFYGKRKIPREWNIFWWAFVAYCLHEFLEMLLAWQWIIGQVAVVLLASSEIISVIFLTYAAYLLAKKYTIKA